jgi:hypothetical protein
MELENILREINQTERQVSDVLFCMWKQTNKKRGSQSRKGLSR